MNLRLLLLSTLTFSIAFISSCYSQTFTPKFVVSADPILKISEDQQYTFGYLEVLENRSKPNGKTIKLPVYIFKSRGDQTAKDPIIYTVGGPGSTTMRSAPYAAYYSYLDDRDFIFFEQRGTYYAQPHLDCPEWSDAIYQSNFPEISETKADSLLRKAAKDCRDKLLKRGIDLNAYNTNEIAADIADLKAALGIEQYNLLTISYSTKIAQVLMRDYPEGIRSVVMDSPLPLEANYDEESVQNLLESYEMLFSDCASDADCNSNFPNLKSRFFTYLEEKTKDPLVVKVIDPNTDKEQTFYLLGKDIINLLSISSPSEVPEVPLVIEKILLVEVQVIREALQSLLESSGSGAGIGMRLSVWCAEETPFASREIIQEEMQKYAAIKGFSPVVYSPEICDIWGVQKVAEIENQAIKSNIPTLLISGEYDNQTPPKWATQMQTNLTNSFHMVFKGWHHTPTTYWNNPCAMTVANAFFNDPQKVPDINCYKKIEKPNFTKPDPPIKKEKPEMVFIKGGTFLMGQEDGEGDERSVHQVTLSDFYIGKKEITVAEYRLFCEATNRDMPIEPEWTWINDHPIVNTSWHNAMAYIAWLNVETGERYRLPTEAEFEYVIRNGGKPGKYPWGEGKPINENIADESLSKINPSKNSWKGYEDGFVQIAPVGSLGPNELGVYDINGNTWEWCSDWYGPYSNTPVTNPTGPEQGAFKVGRGASYNADPWHVRSAGRNWVEPEFEKPGFRLAKD